MDRDLLKAALREVLHEDLGLADVEMAAKWEGGEMVIRSTRGAPREKVIPLEAFFRKIVLVRDRLRIVEQKINAHAGLTEADKVSLHQYVTKAYGTLTTFNFLFRDREDQFVGERKPPGKPQGEPSPAAPSAEPAAPPPAELFPG